MPVAVKASAEVELVERLCRSLGIDPAGVDEMTLHFRVGERPVIRLRRGCGEEDAQRIIADLERYDVVTVRR
jgi:hypothetical protein